MNRHLFTLAIAFAFPILSLLLSACRGTTPHSSTGGRNLSPHEVSFEDIAMYASRNEVNSRVQPLRCTKEGFEWEVCTWHPAKKLRDLEGFEEVRISFRQSEVKGIEVRYAELFDLQYKRIDKTVREKYGPYGGTETLDTVECVWKYDSLTVRFTPNRKQHWTGSFFVYNPVLNIQETLPVKGEGKEE